MTDSIEDDDERKIFGNLSRISESNTEKSSKMYSHNK